MEELIELSQLAVGLAILVFFLVVVVRPVIRPQLAAQIYRAQTRGQGSEACDCSAAQSGG